jgi:hypothetical protein
VASVLDRDRDGGRVRLAAMSAAEQSRAAALTRRRASGTIFVVRLEQPSRRILVEIVVPSGPVDTQLAAAKEPERQPQPQR